MEGMTHQEQQQFLVAQVAERVSTIQHVLPCGHLVTNLLHLNVNIMLQVY